MDDSDKQMLIKLTENQAKFLNEVLAHNRPMASGASIIEGKAKGKIASTLRDSGFITPMGRAGRQTKWKPTPQWEDNWSRFQREIQTILGEIAEE